MAVQCLRGRYGGLCPALFRENHLVWLSRDIIYENGVTVGRCQDTARLQPRR